jgi:apolipoprotein N-acyltransferase
MFGTMKKEAAETDSNRSSWSARKPRHLLFQSIVFPVFGSLLSGILLALSFPGYGNSSLAFIGLVPLMFAVQSASGKKAALLGLLAGFIFFMLSMGWLHNLTGTVAGVALKASALLGYAVLSLYCALYFIPIAITVSICVKHWGVRAFRSNVRLMFSASMVWVAAEYLRSFLFTGFPWNSLGVSQYASPVLIQIADWGGVYIVSACIVWMNTALFITLSQYIGGIRARHYRPHGELMLGLLPVALSVAYGLHILFNPPEPQKPVQVVLVQPNIPQTEKWDREKDQQIRNTLEVLTETAARIDGTDLIVWPETALPDFVRVSAPSQDLVGRMVELGFPLLVGSMDLGYSESTRVYYNSSILFGTNGAAIAKYDKQHLVPFGEYVPFPALMKKFTPIEVDFAAGRESTLVPLEGKAPFSVLICFEDIVAPLSVKAVRNGARWLVNQTNDAWFDPGAQSEQHLAHAVFRCIENRIPMARCCNTGITCTIDAFGNVERSLNPRSSGFAVNKIYPRPAELRQTFYTRHADAFARFALLASATVVFVLRSNGRKQRKKEA